MTNDEIPNDRHYAAAPRGDGEELDFPGDERMTSTNDKGADPLGR